MTDYLAFSCSELIKIIPSFGRGFSLPSFEGAFLCPKISRKDVFWMRIVLRGVSLCEACRVFSLKQYDIFVFDNHIEVVKKNSTERV